MLLLFILSRVLFVASMVFIIGYVFGNFSKSRTLTTFTKIASILTIILFIGSNAFLVRNNGWQRGSRGHYDRCYFSGSDSTSHR